MSLPTRRDYLLRFERADPMHCPVCYNPFTRPYDTPCGHVLCRQCAKRWFTESAACPICRVNAYQPEPVPGAIRGRARGVQAADRNNYFLPFDLNIHGTIVPGLLATNQQTMAIVEHDYQNLQPEGILQYPMLPLRRNAHPMDDADEENPGAEDNSSTTEEDMDIDRPSTASSMLSLLSELSRSLTPQPPHNNTTRADSTGPRTPSSTLTSLDAETRWYHVGDSIHEDYWRRDEAPVATIELHPALDASDNSQRHPDLHTPPTLRANQAQRSTASSSVVNQTASSTPAVGTSARTTRRSGSAHRPKSTVVTRSMRARIWDGIILAPDSLTQQQNAPRYGLRSSNRAQGRILYG